MPSSKPLAIVPTYIRNEKDVEVTIACLNSIKETADVDILVVDDGSEEYWSSLLEVELPLGVEAFWKPFNTGFSSTVNVGLRRALATGQDAILINADMLFFEKGWLDCLRMPVRFGVSVVGGLLLYPNGTIQHAGIYYSPFYREFDHIYRFAPGNLPEAQVGRVCPVTGALMYITNETLHDVGVFDEDFRFGFEDIDYCFRVSQAGRGCWFNPQARAIHREAYFTRQDKDENEARIRRGLLKLTTKHAGFNFGPYVPTLLED